MFEADIQAAIDRQLEIERKARVLDQLTALLERDRGGIISVDEILCLVHAAQTTSTC